ncbi:SacI homology domain-containing protein [Chytriomyces sp. MP71]|nr:SacI homology domain-containing protein [Chytriomyces sp. MP71]
MHDTYSGHASPTLDEKRGFGIVGILDLTFKKFLISISSREMAANIHGKTIWRVTDVRTTEYFMSKHFLSLDEEEHERTILGHVTTMLTSGSFYYSTAMDVTCSRQQLSEMEHRWKKARLEKEQEEKFQADKESAENGEINHVGADKITFSSMDSMGVDASVQTAFDMIDTRFCFNMNLLDSLYCVETFRFIVPLIFGFVGSYDFQVDHITYSYALISRCSNKRAGTRYFRGLDKDGSSAIEVETEFMFITADRSMSFRQVRGSTPLLWKSSPPDEILQPVKIDLSESGNVDSQSALKRHLYNLLDRYNSPITLVSLLSRKHGNENLCSQYQMLADTFRQVLAQVASDVGEQNLKLIEYDESELARNPHLHMELLLNLLRPALKQQGFFCMKLADWDDAEGNTIQSAQLGAFRVNGIDCVDMTNVLQFKLSVEAIQNMMKFSNFPAELEPRHWERIKCLWVQNGRALAYLSTGVPRVLYEELIKPNWRHSAFGGYVWYAIVRIGRLYMGTFRDSRRQEEFECMLGSTKQTVQDAIHLRKSLLRLATHQKFNVAFFLMVKRFFSPTHVNTLFNLFLAAIWLLSQAIVRLCVGEETWSASTLPRVGSKLDTSAIPQREEPVPHGLQTEISKRKRQVVKDLLNKTEGSGSLKATHRRKLSFS